jgi:predicted small secreted protein
MKSSIVWPHNDMHDEHKMINTSVILVVFSACACLLSACGTMPNGRGWGQDATLAPGWDRVGQAAWNAARSPATWGPAAGALALQIDHADRHVVQWAARENPVFGSRENASRMSDHLLEASGALWAASMVAAPSGDTASDWSLAKAGGGGVQTGGGILMRETVGFLKQNTDRSRPSGGHGSFPSAHASGAAQYSAFAAANMEAWGWSQGAVAASNIGLGAITAATAWARVEANFHYPSDVLAGVAIGHFFGVFFTDAFLGLDNPKSAMVLLEPSREGAVALVRFKY